MASILPVPLSELDEIKDPDSFFVFASRTNADGSVESGKVMFAELGEAIKKLQLERRISLTMESNETEMFIGEEMTIYRIEGYNVSECRVNGNVVPIGKEVEVSLPKGELSTFSATRPLTDSKAYLFIYAKAKSIS
jgi:hypothetical protein